jgi:MYXO-CTERM domain-containing protein
MWFTAGQGERRRTPNADDIAGLCAIYPSSRAIRCDPEVRMESLEGGGCSASPGGRGGVGIALFGGVVAALAAWRRRRSASNS